MSSKTIRAVIVDDEQLARRYLRDLLAAHPDVEIVAECANGFETVKAVHELSPDLLFLDIQMPKLNGFEVLELIEDPVSVIFVTAYDQYAVKAFDACAVDYLLKPFSPERLDEALKKLPHAHHVEADLTALSNASRPGHLTRIVLKDGSRVVILQDHQIDYIQAEGDYVEIHSKGEAYLKLQTMGSLEQRLDKARFVRIHRSTILNVERLERIELLAKDRHVAFVKGGAELPISRSGHKRLRELLS